MKINIDSQLILKTFILFPTLDFVLFCALFTEINTRVSLPGEDLVPEPEV